MRNIALLILSSFMCLFSFSQKTEISIAAGSGLFFYTGASAVSHQNVSRGDFVPLLIRDIPGKKPAFSQTAGLEVNYSSKANWLTGFQFQAQRLVSKWMIDSLIFILMLDPRRQQKLPGLRSMRNILLPSILT